MPLLYDLDRLDLTVSSTLDRRAQADVTRFLQRLRDPDQAQAAGLRGYRLLDRGDPARVVYSFTLYERGPEANLLRVQTDNLGQPLDVNEGIKLELGSSAKLRTLISYLEIIAALHAQHAGFPPEALATFSFAKPDRLGRWAMDYLTRAEDRSLPAMLNAALERLYSASPEERFFTNGGQHTFANFDPEDDGKVMSVREAFSHSVNLVFIRLMRDIVDYYIFHGTRVEELLESKEDARRQEYLERFADREGQIFLNRFYHRYQGKTPEGMLAILLQRFYLTPVRLAAVLRFVAPEADEGEFAAWVRRHLPETNLTDKTLSKLYADYAPTAYALADRGHIARVHPLELWMVAYLRHSPQATWNEVVAASAVARQATYAWLFRTHRKNRQDTRILILLEVQAFQELHRQWKRLGYPFEYLAPSLATAIGSSGDRPAALAELVGIVLDDGVRRPAARIQELHFAAGTPLGDGVFSYPPAFLNVTRGRLRASAFCAAGTSSRRICPPR